MAPATRVRRALSDRPNPPPTPPLDNSAIVEDALLPLGKPSSLNSSFTSNVERLCLATLGPETPFLPGEALYDALPSSSPVGEETRSSKKVDFSGWTTYHKPPAMVGTNLIRSPKSQLKPLPSSTDRPNRSILKTRGQAMAEAQEIAELVIPDSEQPRVMSLVHKLCEAERQEKLDGYMGLTALIKEIKDPQLDILLSERLIAVQDTILDDLEFCLQSTNPSDITLSQNVLRLATVLAWNPNTWPQLRTQFCEVMLDQCVAVLTSPKTSKIMTNLVVHFLAQQSFPGNLMNNHLVAELCNALKEVHIRVSGNSIVGERLMAYRRFVQQNPQGMGNLHDSWINQLFSGMLSSIKEIRMRAIALGVEVGYSCGTMPKVSQAILDVFDGQVGGVVCAEYFTKRLTSMLENLEGREAAHASQIWSVTVLMLRAKPKMLDRWKHLKIWLRVIQKAFNVLNKLVRSQAYDAWSKFIFAIHTHQSPGKNMLRLLKQPFLPGLSRQRACAKGDESRTHSLSALCALLYFSFRPSAKWEELDESWSELVTNGIRSWTAPEDVADGVKVVNVLLAGKQDLPWSMNKFEGAELMRPQNLPRIDPRWTRNRVEIVIHDVQPFLARLVRSAEPHSSGLSQSLVSSIASAITIAGSKEIKVTEEASNAADKIWTMILELPNSLSDSTSEPPSPLEKRSLDVASYTALFVSAINNLGIRTFTKPFAVEAQGPTPRTREQGPCEKALKIDYAIPFHRCFGAILGFGPLKWPDQTLAKESSPLGYCELMKAVLDTSCKANAADAVHVLSVCAGLLKYAHGIVSSASAIDLMTARHVLALAKQHAPDASEALTQILSDVLGERETLKAPELGRAESKSMEGDEVAEPGIRNPLPRMSEVTDNVVETNFPAEPDEADAVPSPSDPFLLPTEMSYMPDVATTYFPNIMTTQPTEAQSPVRDQYADILSSSDLRPCNTAESDNEATPRGNHTPPPPSSSADYSGFAGSSPTPGSRSVDIAARKAKFEAQHNQPVEPESIEDDSDMLDVDDHDMPSSPPDIPRHLAYAMASQQAVDRQAVDQPEVVIQPSEAFDPAVYEQYSQTSVFSSSPPKFVLPPRVHETRQPLLALPSSQLGNPSYSDQDTELINSDATQAWEDERKAPVVPAHVPLHCADHITERIARDPDATSLDEQAATEAVRRLLPAPDLSSDDSEKENHAVSDDDPFVVKPKSARADSDSFYDARESQAEDDSTDCNKKSDNPAGVRASLGPFRDSKERAPPQLKLADKFRAGFEDKGAKRHGEDPAIINSPSTSEKLRLGKKRKAKKQLSGQAPRTSKRARLSDLEVDGEVHEVHGDDEWHERNLLEDATDEHMRHRQVARLHEVDEKSHFDTAICALTRVSDAMEGDTVQSLEDLRELDNLLFEIRCRAHASYEASQARAD